MIHKILINNRYLLLALLLGVGGTGTAAPADDVPVVDAAHIQALTDEQRQQPDAFAAHSSGEMVHDALPSPSEPIRALSVFEMHQMKQQLRNFVGMNLPEKIIQLQEEVAYLRGELEREQNKLKSMSAQQITLYKDLSQQIKQLQTSQSDHQSHPKVESTQPASLPSTFTTSKPVLKKVASVSDSERAKIKEGAHYKQALKELLSKQYNKALELFDIYLVKYPKGFYAANAHYWRGQVYFFKNIQEEARKEFTIVINEFPGSTKASEAKLKIAILDLRDGKIESAKVQFAALSRSKNPTVSRLARNHLMKIEKQKVTDSSIPSL